MHAFFLYLRFLLPFWTALPTSWLQMHFERSTSLTAVAMQLSGGDSGGDRPKSKCSKLVFRPPKEKSFFSFILNRRPQQCTRWFTRERREFSSQAGRSAKAPALSRTKLTLCVRVHVRTYSLFYLYRPNKYRWGRRIAPGPKGWSRTWRQRAKKIDFANAMLWKRRRRRRRRVSKPFLATMNWWGNNRPSDQKVYVCTCRYSTKYSI